MKKVIFYLIAFLLIPGLLIAGTNTTNLTLYKPDVGEQNWGSSVNNNFNILDTAVGTNINSNGSFKTSFITGKTEDGTPGSGDFFLIYDSATGQLQKADVGNVPGSGGVSTIGDATDTTISSPSISQLLIYDGVDSWDNKSVSGDITITDAGVVAIGDSSVQLDDIQASGATTSSTYLRGDGTWATISSGGATTDGGAVTYVTSDTDDFAAGGIDATAPLFFDESAQTLTIDGTIYADGIVVQGTGDSFITLDEVTSEPGAVADKARVYAYDDSSVTKVKIKFSDGSTTTLQGDVSDVFNCASGDCATVVLASTDTLDAGAGTLEIPNGASPTVDATGEIAIDTTSDQLRFYGASSERVIPTDNPLNFALTSPDNADSILLGKLPYGITITDIHCIVDPADTSESVVIDIQECNATGDSCATVDATITCDNDGAEDDGTLSNATLDAGDWYNLDIGTVTGTVSFVSGSVYFEVVGD